METRPSAVASAGPATRPSHVSRLLVAGQFVLLAGLAATAAWPGPWERGTLCAGGALGLWALAAMPIRQLRVVPETHPRGRLVRSGPYRMIRHPMYSAVLLVAAGMLATKPAPARLGTDARAPGWPALDEPRKTQLAHDFGIRGIFQQGYRRPVTVEPAQREFASQQRTELRFVDVVVPDIG